MVGESYGGMIAQYLAARHGESCGHVAIVVAAAEVSDWGKEVDARLASALARGDTAGVRDGFRRVRAPGERSRWARRLVGPWIGRSLLSGKNYPPGDLLVEIEAEISFDARPVLPRIEMPVVLLCGDRDRFFPMEVVEETVRLIPDCTLVRYEGQGHMKVATSRRVAHDVLAFVNRISGGRIVRGRGCASIWAKSQHHRRCLRRAYPNAVSIARPRQMPSEVICHGPSRLGSSSRSSAS